MVAFSWNWDVFLMVLIALLALSLIIFGILTAYFGSNKSRMVGVILFIVGIIFGLFTIFGSYDIFHVSFIAQVLEPAIFYIIAAIIGVIIGLLIFLGAIMKT